MDLAARLARAPQAAAVDPRALPYAGGPEDGPPVLVLHGFTGSPFSMRPWAEHLADARLPRRACRGCPGTARAGAS